MLLMSCENCRFESWPSDAASVPLFQFELSLEGFYSHCYDRQKRIDSLDSL